MKELKLKIGARVVVVYNVDTPDGLVNGEMGTVLDIVKNTKGEVQHIVVKFDLEETGEMAREKNPHIASRYEQDNGTPIFRQMLDYQVGKAKKLSSSKARLWQFPLKLAFASTGHKMQVKKNDSCYLFILVLQS